MKHLSLLALLISGLTEATLQLKPLTGAQNGQIAQFSLNDSGEPVIITQQGELWLLGNQPQKLAEQASPYVAPLAAFSRVAYANHDGNFHLWTPQQQYHSNIQISEQAKMLALPLATIAVIKQEGKALLARLETEDEKITLRTHTNFAVLPDARPLQIDLENLNDRGHIAILAEPDNQTYQHAVLGDTFEASSLTYLERHTLQPIYPILSVKNRVFEANQLEQTILVGENALLSVMAGDGGGAQAVIIKPKNDKLHIMARSEALPNHRWQSPFVFNGKIYAVQMPHLVGRLVEFHQNGEKLEEQTLGTGFSNHAYGAHETNLAAITNNFAFIPHSGYREISVLDRQGNINKLNITLPAEIHESFAHSDKAYFLLKNGEVWVATDE